VGAYRVQGNLENAELLPTFDATDVPSGDPFQLLVERSAEGDGVRLPPPGGLPPWFRFRVGPHRDETRAPYYVSDALSSTHTTFGVDTLVSQSARDKLAPYVARQCEFLPVEVENVEQPYYALWITRLLDVMDPEGVNVVTPLKYLPRRANGAYPLRINRYRFREERLAGVLLFRLPGHNLAEQSMSDYGTDGFVDLTRELGISGFSYFSAITEPAFRPGKGQI
jgi:hypothetical protein